MAAAMNEYGRMYAKEYASNHQDPGAETAVLKADAASVQAAGAAALHRIAGKYSGFTPAEVQKMSLQEKVGHAAAFGVPDLAKDIVDEAAGALLVAIPLYGLLHLGGVGEVLDGILVGLALFGKAQAIRELIRFFGVARAKNEGDLRAAGDHLANAVKDFGIGKTLKIVKGMVQTMNRLHALGDAKMISHAAHQANDLSGPAYQNVAHPLAQELGIEQSEHKKHK